MAISRVQSAKNSASGATSVVVTFGSAPTNGNFLVVGVYVSSSTVSTITTTGVTWTQAVVKNNGGINVYIYYVSNISGAGSTITINVGASSDLMAIAAEYSGIQNSPLDKTASNSGSSATADSGTTATTTQANELWIGWLTATSVTIGAPSNGFTNVDTQTVSAVEISGLEEKIVSSTGAANTSATIVSGTWTGAIATFTGVSSSNQLMMMGIGA